MLSSFLKVGKQFRQVRHFAAAPQRVEATEDVVDRLTNTHDAAVQLSQDGDEIKPRQASTDAPLVVEYATPDIISKKGFKPEVLGLSQRLRELDERFSSAQEQADQRFAASHKEANERSEQQEERFAASEKQADQRFAAQEERIGILEFNLRHTREIAVSVILREVLKHFRGAVWYCRNSKKYSALNFNKWVNNKFADDETVFFIDELIHDPSATERALLTWGFLRNQARHPLKKDPDALQFPTGQMNSKAHDHIAELTAFAVVTTEAKSDTTITFDMYKMMLRATDRDDVVLQHMRSPDMQKANKLDL